MKMENALRGFSTGVTTISRTPNLKKMKLFIPDNPNSEFHAIPYRREMLLMLISILS